MFSRSAIAFIALAISMAGSVAAVPAPGLHEMMSFRNAKPFNPIAAYKRAAAVIPEEIATTAMQGKITPYSEGVKVAARAGENILPAEEAVMSPDGGIPVKFNAKKLGARAVIPEEIATTAMQGKITPYADGVKVAARAGENILPAEEAVMSPDGGIPVKFNGKKLGARAVIPEEIATTAMQGKITPYSEGVKVAARANENILPAELAVMAPDGGIPVKFNGKKLSGRAANEKILPAELAVMSPDGGIPVKFDSKKLGARASAEDILPAEIAVMSPDGGIPVKFNGKKLAGRAAGDKILPAEEAVMSPNGDIPVKFDSKKLGARVVSFEREY